MVRLLGMTWAHPRGLDGLVAASEAYRAERPDVDLEWQVRPLQAFADEPIDSLAARYDLIVMDHPHVGHAAAVGALAPLDGAGHDAELAELARLTVGRSHESYASGGRQWALAVDAAAQTACFRPDLIAREDVPRTWAGTLELARTGKVLWPVKPVDAMMSFLTLMANIGAPCGEGERFFDPAIGERVLKEMQALAQLVPTFCLRDNPIDTLERMAQEDGWSFCPLLFNYSNYSRPGFRPKLVAFTDIPAIGTAGPEGAILGGAGIAVSAKSRNVQAAIDFAFWVCGAEVQAGVYFEGGGQPGNAAAWDSDRVNAQCADFFRATRRTLERSYLRPRYHGFMQLQSDGSEIVHAALRGDATARDTAAALEAAYQRSRHLESH